MHDHIHFQACGGPRIPKYSRDPGIHIIGEIPWGTHFCLFYQSKEDLADILVPYYKAGLQNNECCVCVASRPFNADKLTKVLRERIPGFDGYVKKGQIEIIPHTGWYVKDKTMELDRVLAGWMEKLEEALARRFDGLRVSGDTAWLGKKTWDDFLAYEHKVNDSIGDHKMIALCTYPLDRCGAIEILDVASAHQFALIRQAGAWRLVESKMAKRSLRESEKKYRNILETAEEGIWYVDARGRTIFANRRMAEMLGCTVEELKNSSVYDHVDDQQEKGADRVDNAGLLGALQKRDLKFRRKDGSDLWAIVSSHPFFDSGGLYSGSLAMVTDITERKRAEEALRESEAKYKTLFEDGGTAIYIADVETGTIIDCNSNAVRLIGRQRGEIIGMHQAQLHPPERMEEYCEDFKWHAQLDRVANYEAEVQHRDGRRIPIIINATQLVIDGRKIMMGFFVDNTERKHSELELQDAKSRAELYLDLMGHDINNLNQIGLGFLELALETLDLDDGARDLISKPLEALESSSRLIDNVRKLQRVKEGGLKFHAVNIGDMVRAILPRYSRIVGRNIKINYAEDGEFYVWSNDLLADVFSNIIDNAIKHSSGPLTIDIRLSHAWVDGREYCTLEFEDDGPGIPDDLKKKLLTKYEKSNKRSSRKGLGLYLVKTLVEDFHGKIYIEDRVRGDHTKGVRFEIMLPAAGQ